MNYILHHTGKAIWTILSIIRDKNGFKIRVTKIVPGEQTAKIDHLRRDAFEKIQEAKKGCENYVRIKKKKYAVFMYSAEPGGDMPHWVIRLLYRSRLLFLVVLSKRRMYAKLLLFAVSRNHGGKMARISGLMRMLLFFSMLRGSREEPVSLGR